MNPTSQTGTAETVCNLRPGRVALEGLDGTFACYIEDGRNWNGYARPWFNEGQANAVVTAINDARDMGEDTHAGYKPGKVVVTFDGAREEFEGVRFQDHGQLYPIGNGSWMWAEVGVTPLGDLRVVVADARGKEFARTTLGQLLQDYPCIVIGAGDIKQAMDATGFWVFEHPDGECYDVKLAEDPATPGSEFCRWLVAGHPGAKWGTAWREIHEHGGPFSPRFVGIMIRENAENTVRDHNGRGLVVDALRLAIKRAEDELMLWPVKELGNTQHLSLRTYLGKLQAALAATGGAS